MTTETDRELLKWAAKAAGMEHPTYMERVTGVVGINRGPMAALWNPLTDDGDALRLAVKRNVFFNPLFAHYLALERFAQQDADDTKAYRRAIVRTVADEGKDMTCHT